MSTNKSWDAWRKQPTPEPQSKVRFLWNGEEISEEEFQEKPSVGGLGIPMGSTTYSASKPLVSQGLGCMRHQVPEMREEVKKHGLSSVHIREDGAAELTSRGDTGRRGLMKMRGMRDNDGGYGDG